MSEKRVNILPDTLWVTFWTVFTGTTDTQVGALHTEFFGD